jgi:3-deoxy-manno-octulosonate cytidylyltransferase (CMP-KDO synthetase)
MSSIVAIIPARYASTRLPGKPLVDIGGLPMILHVIERAREAPSINRVIVATDDQRIYDVVESAGHEALMTSAGHRTGTDRLAEAASGLEADVIVNLQGDEPLIDPATIEAVIRPLLDDPQLVMATTCEPIDSVADALDPSVVKVVCDRESFALYFSRNPIPFLRSATLVSGALETALDDDKSLLTSYAKHTGLYAYRRSFLLTLAKLEQTPLERAESLEQLRAIENGFRIKVVMVAHRSIGVDTPEDLERARELMRARTRPAR